MEFIRHYVMLSNIFMSLWLFLPNYSVKMSTSGQIQAKSTTNIQIFPDQIIAIELVHFASFALILVLMASQSSSDEAQYFLTSGSTCLSNSLNSDSVYKAQPTKEIH